MADRSAIEWCDSTFNPWIGCTKVSPACDHCYAAVSTPARALGVAWGAGEPRHRTSASAWKRPLSWNNRPFVECLTCGIRGDAESIPGWGRKCKSCGNAGMVPARRRVFCASLADVFDNEIDPAWRSELFALIQSTPNLDWLLLTKRIGNAAAMLPYFRKDPAGRLEQAPIANVWLGATICNQQEADRDIPKLLATPATIRFVSIEPLLGSIDLTNLAAADGYASDVLSGYRHDFGVPIADLPARLDWVIAGGESGHNARPMDPNWVYALRNQCEDAGVAFLFKQWGEWHPLERLPIELDATPRRIDADTSTVRIGKKHAGRLVDGIEHNEFPSLRPIAALDAGGAS